MNEITLCMIVKNEEKVIDRCLDSIKNFVDEIIIIDTGSIDNTIAIAKKYTDKIYHFEWIDDFSAARNFAMKFATKQYILWLDADDILPETEHTKFTDLKKELHHDVITMKYIQLENSLGEQTSYNRNMLIKRSKNLLFSGAVHEQLILKDSTVMKSGISILHKPSQKNTKRNLLIYQKLIDKGESLTFYDSFFYANELLDNQQYKKAIDIYEKLLTYHIESYELEIYGNLADCYYMLHDDVNFLDCIYESFKYGPSNAEIFCRLGFYFLRKENHNRAITWFEQATKSKRTECKLSIYKMPYWTWLPYLQLCVCYAKMGKYDKAYQHNELAAKFAPNNLIILKNRAEFNKIKGGIK